MKRPKLAVTVLGDGGWGTTLALHAHRLRHNVRWWGAFPDYLALISRRRQNIRYLPGVAIPPALRIVPDLCKAVESADIIILAIPSQHMRKVLARLSKFRLPAQAHFVSVAKGLELESLKRMSELIMEELGKVSLAVLSGPNIAAEIARGYPASSVVACAKSADARFIQSALMNERLRLYTSKDVAGVELGGALKNPIAIAAGIGDGLGFGPNTKAALITRGVVEIARLGKAMGAGEDTFRGLSGLGDLITTCFSGRNRWLGEQLGKGHSLKSVLASTPMVMEGVSTAKAAVALARRHKVELPIIEQVCAVLFRNRSPQKALHILMTRTGKDE